VTKPCVTSPLCRSPEPGHHLSRHSGRGVSKRIAINRRSRGQLLKVASSWRGGHYGGGGGGGGGLGGLGGGGFGLVESMRLIFLPHHELPALIVGEQERLDRCLLDRLIVEIVRALPDDRHAPAAQLGRLRWRWHTRTIGHPAGESESPRSRRRRSSEKPTSQPQGKAPRLRG
jgi:hypothetical protein